MDQTYLSARQQRLSAQVFSIASITAVLAPPLIMLWIAASIFVYAAIAHHPNPRVVEYLRPAGYRFYGLAGSLVVVLNYTEIMKHWFGGALHMWLAVWLVSLLVIVPMGLRDIVRAAREPWADLTSRGGVRQAMVEIRATTPDAGFSVESRPNCSLSWLGTVYLFAIIALYALVIAMGFALIGAWPVTRA